MRTLIHDIAAGLLIGGAVLATIVVVTRVCFDQGAASRARIADWKQLVDHRQPVLGAANARLQVIEFADYASPFSRDLERKLGELSTAHPDRFAVLRYECPRAQTHARAMAAAVASKCASRQAGYQAFHALLVAHGAELADVDYRALAQQARLSNLDAFVACLDGPDARAAVQADMAVADKLGFKDMPMLVVNGDVLRGTQDKAKLRALLVAN